MKTRVSKTDFYITVVFLCAMLAVMIYELSDIKMLTEDLSGAMLFFLAWLIVLFALLLFVLIDKKSYFRVIIKNGKITTKFMGRQFCELDSNDELYFIPYWQGSRYFIISKEPICYFDSVKLNTTYDTATQIVIPYNKKTKDFLPYDKWKRCSFDKKYKQHLKWWQKPVLYKLTAYDNSFNSEDFIIK